jgi:ribonuclease E
LVEVSDPVFLDTAEGEEPVADELSEPAVEGESDAEEPAASDSTERGERRRRRKKRRRRKPAEGSARDGQGGADEPPLEPAFSAPADSGPAEQYLETVLSGDETTESSGEAPAEAVPEGERREGRKRRRRRRKKRTGESSASAAESSTAEPQDETSTASTAEHDAEAEHDDAEFEQDDTEFEHDDAEFEHDDGDGEEGDGTSSRLSHRAIPTWDQAIGFIIARNMEARAKHPSGPSRRGGKGRRPDRGRS